MMKPVFEIAVAIVGRGDRWLVTRRLPDAHLGGLWEFPGGKCEPDESPTEAAIRELLEESGVEADIERALAVQTHDYGDRIVRITPIVCRWESGEPKTLANAECRWVSADELRKLEMPPVNAAIIHTLLDQA